jgi:hypothetical protein
MMPPAYWPRSASCSFMESARPWMVLAAISHRLYSWVVAGGSYGVGRGGGGGHKQGGSILEGLHRLQSQQGVLCACFIEQA